MSGPKSPWAVTGSKRSFRLIGADFFLGGRKRFQSPNRTRKCALAINGMMPWSRTERSNVTLRFRNPNGELEATGVGKCRYGRHQSRQSSFRSQPLRYTLRIPASTPVLPRAIIFFLAAVVFGQSSIPNHRFTPGSVATTDTNEVCQIGYAKKHREFIRTAVRRRIFARYNIPFESRVLYELDHLIPLGEGGANDERNLWPQPRVGKWSAQDKDRLERRLKTLICSRQMTLADAQRGMATNWINLYKQVFSKSRRQKD